MIKKILNTNNSMISIIRPHYAAFAGLSGSAASIFGKLISQTEYIVNNSFIVTDQQEFYWNCLLKVIFLILMVICNIFVWFFFVKSLQEPGGSVIATVTSTSTNYCCSAIVGNRIFEEQVSPLWWLGTSLVIVGVVFVSLSTNERKIEKKTK